jgi:hypothetical protein
MRLPEAVTTNYDNLYESACEQPHGGALRVLPREGLNVSEEHSSGHLPWMLNLNPPLAVRRGNAEMPFCLEKMGVLDTSRSQGEGHLLDATVTHTGGIVSVV